MPQLAEDLSALKSSLADRAKALDTYLEGLKADHGRSEGSFRRALDICRAYTRTFVKQLDEDWEQASDRDQYRQTLSSALKSFLRRERWIDERFARSTQSDVPRALKTIASQQFDELDLEWRDPVLTVGPPDSFETQLADLSSFLFADIYVPLEVEDVKLTEAEAKLSIFSVPYIEGTRVLWYPIVVGHEIAHIRLDQGVDRPSHLKTTEPLASRRDIRFSGLLDELVHQAPDPALIVRNLNRQLLRWAEELICDLNAVRLFGPAGLAAIAEFLSILQSQSQAELLDSDTHPPLSIRLKVLFQYLERVGWDDSTLPPFATVWREQERHSGPKLDNRATYLTHFLSEPGSISMLIEFVEGWGDFYAPGQTTERFQAVAAELLDGIPGASHVRLANGSWSKVNVFDVVNATWAARHALDDSDTAQRLVEGDSAGACALLESNLDDQTKRLRLDSLASKAIDTLELGRLWKGERGIISPAKIRQGSPLGKGDGASATGSVLSRSTMQNLIDGPSAPRERLVVTPLFEDSVQDAAVDLRLGPDFIVFKHSATTAFDPLAEDEPDPRTMQERVHKDWGERFILHPGELVLASTLEYIAVPENVAAQVLTRSSYGRLGLLTATAVQVQPGSRGCITLELVNQGETPIALSPAARVAQLMLWFIDDPCEIEVGKYRFPVGPEFSKVSKDPDTGALRDLGRSADKRQRPGFEQRLLLRFDAEGGLADSFYEIAEKLGANEVRGTSGSRVGLSVKILALTIQRWLQGQNPSLVVELMDGLIEVRADRELPPRSVTIVDARGTELETLTMPPETPEELAQVLRTLRQSTG
jgi:deoxycytidine triphosphate deaminase